MRLNGVVAARQDGQVSTYGLDFVDNSVAHEVDVAFADPGLESRPTRAHVVADEQEDEASSLRGFSEKAKALVRIPAYHFSLRPPANQCLQLPAYHYKIFFQY